MGGVFGVLCGFEVLFGVFMLIVCDLDCWVDEIEIVNVMLDFDDNLYCVVIVIVFFVGW